MPYLKRSRDEHLAAGGPKRILCLDGGGLRGILSLQFLARIEEILRTRHEDDPDFRLAHYFDLIAGTSTGAIIAAALARGLSVEEITRHYLEMGQRIFRGGRFLGGVLQARYKSGDLEALLKRVLGPEVTLGSPDLLTGVLIVAKRVDTGSPWPLGNNPGGKYFRAKPGASWLSNADYPLWQVVRASTAAPTYFDPEHITIGAGANPFRGEFVDGGVSPFNNPSLQAFMYATMGGYGLNWKKGEDNLLIVSLGTGTDDPGIARSRIAAEAGIRALSGLMDDCATLVETVMQWMSSSPTARLIDREIGTLEGDLLCGAPLFRYLRYNVALTREGLSGSFPGIDEQRLRSLAEMDRPENLAMLQRIGDIAAQEQVHPDHLPAAFDLTV